MNTTTTNADKQEQVRCSAWFGWWVICLHDYPEPEGTIFLPMCQPPKKGDKLKMPSDGSEWVVDSVNEHEGTFTVVQPNAEVSHDAPPLKRQ